MRAGDRTDRGREAHIIETADGLLIGSFTRLTKIRMKDFRQLLEDEASKRPLLDLRPVAQKSEAREARRASLEQRAHTNETKAERLRIQERLPSIVPFNTPERLRPGLQIYFQDWKMEMQAARGVLNAKHPLEKKYGPEIPLDIQSQRIMDLIQQGRERLKKAHEAVQRAREELEELEAERWVIFKRQKVSKAEEALQQALAQLGEILRYIVQAVLYYLGLSGAKPAPLQLPVPMERQMSCAEYAESRQKLLHILLNEKACRAWVKGHCLDTEHKRARLIEQWHDERAPEVARAEQTVVQLQTLARPPRRIPEEVRARIVTLKRRGDFQAALNEIRLLEVVPRPESVGQPADKLPLQPLERGRRGHHEQKMSL